jgi:ABC transport system ATP-binding/permease protein
MTRYLLLHYRSKARVWQQIPLGDGLFTIGRTLDNNLVVDDWLASRNHAILRVSEQGVWIQDQNSSNGTMVKGQRIPPVEWVPVPIDEDIIIGVTTIRVQKA